MVRFSDILGGTSEPEDADPIEAALMSDPSEPDGDAADAVSDAEESDSADASTPELESPKDVLERLTQYATSARGSDQVIPPAADPADDVSDEPSGEPTDLGTLAPVADDILPNAKGVTAEPDQRRRGRRRRP